MSRRSHHGPPRRTHAPARDRRRSAPSQDRPPTAPAASPTGPGTVEAAPLEATDQPVSAGQLPGPDQAAKPSLPTPEVALGDAAVAVDAAVDEPSVDEPSPNEPSANEPLPSVANGDHRPALGPRLHRPVGGTLDGMPEPGERGPDAIDHGATAPQLRRFIKSRAYVPMHELRRRFGINGDDDEVTPVDVDAQRVFVGLPSRECRLLADLLRGGDIGYELSLDPIAPIVVGVYPIRPVPRA